MDGRQEWVWARDALVRDITGLGFPEELGIAIAKQLGSPKAMQRMSAYLYNVRVSPRRVPCSHEHSTRSATTEQCIARLMPKSEELIVDEMLAICSEINAWRDKKASEEANAAYNEILY